ncbi:MAG: triose-phosphate isomerase [Sedimentisphaerales bacterium]
MRKPFVAGNWKMNTDSHSSVELAKRVASGSSQIAGHSVTVAVCPPFVYLQSVAKALSASSVAVGAQDVYFETKGAFTGEISASMLKDIGCSFVLCGHSERRHVVGETDELINKKVTAAIVGGLLPILCVGELLAERDAGQTEQVVTRQLKNGLADLSVEKVSAVTIAYEPVWAIGTGRTATPQQAQEAHDFTRKLLAQMYNDRLAEEIRILYGGSVKPANAADLMRKPDVDGLLVGGASLNAEDFLAIIQAAV